MIDVVKVLYFGIYDFAFKLGWKGHTVHVNNLDNLDTSPPTNTWVIAGQLRPNSEMIRWANENVKGSWCWDNRIQGYVTFCFSRKDDAALFKLTW